MVGLSTLKDYIGLPPNVSDEIAQLCLDAAKSNARAAGIPDYKNNKQYDLFLCALASCFYDNRGMAFVGDASAQESAQRMINAFVLELRNAGEDDG